MSAQGIINVEAGAFASVYQLQGEEEEGAPPSSASPEIADQSKDIFNLQADLSPQDSPSEIRLTVKDDPDDDDDDGRPPLPAASTPASPSSFTGVPLSPSRDHVVPESPPASPLAYRPRPATSLKNPPITLRQLCLQRERRLIDAVQDREAAELARDEALNLLRKERVLANERRRRHLQLEKEQQAKQAR